MSVDVSQHVHHVDARHSVFNDVAGSQYNTYNTTVNPDYLRNLKPADMDASARTECIPDTRLDILGFMKKWAGKRRGDSEQNVMWLHGVAGSGKSTLATTIANYFRERGRLGAFVFFNRDIAERSDPAMVVRTLAYQLGSSDQRIGAAISAAIASMPSIAQSPIRLQFSKLLVEPLSSVEDLQTGEPLVVVLDALDECGNAKNRQSLLEILSQESACLCNVLRIIITSRAEIDIKRYFDCLPHVLPRELDITSDVNLHDITTYLRKRTSIIRQNNRYLSLPHDWPGNSRLLALSARASGLFVWAFIACNFIEDGHDPEERLGILLRAEVAAEAESALDTLYRTALGCSGKWNDPLFGSEFRTILGVILVARNPLSCIAIDALVMPMGRPSLHTISHFGCVLRWKDDDGPVRTLHPSFVDFLSNRDRCGNDAWFINTESFNSQFAKDCLRRLDQVLQKNICNLTLSQAEVNEGLSDDISYACTFWIEHVCMIPPDVTIGTYVEDFLVKHLLHWFEAMSILKIFRMSIGILNRLYDRITTTSSARSFLAELIGDAHRFSQAFVETCERHPLLVYASALPFTPSNTTLYKNFHGTDNVPWVAGRVEKSWSPLLLVILGHSESVRSVAFSPDGRRIASGSSDMTVRVWDASSGANVLPPLLGHEDVVLSVAFSPDGQRIASGSLDKTIRIWDATSGAPLLPPLRGHGGWVWSVAFSPDGTRVASGSNDATIRVWDARSGVEVLAPFRGHTNWVLSVAFSPDGSRIISGSEDRSVRVWDATSGFEAIPPLQTDGPVKSVVCSGDGKQIFWSGPSDIQMWNASLGPGVTQNAGPVHRVTLVALSPDGARIVSGSEDRRIHVWDTTSVSSWRIRAPLRGHDATVTSVAVSRDGARCVSGSEDHTVRLWDITPHSDEAQGLPEQMSPVLESTSLVMSPNRALVITSSGPCMRLWSTTSGTILPTSEALSSTVRSATFSASGHRMASVSDNSTIRVWDTLSGVQLLDSRIHRRIVVLAFSPDGTRIVCGMDDHSIRVIDVASGNLIFERLEGHTGPVLSVAYSFNGSCILSGSMDKSVRVWDAHSGSRLLPPLNGHQGWISSVAFSPDGERIVSASVDGRIRLWDVMSGVTAGPDISVSMDGLDYPTLHVAFSSDGKLVICRAANKTIYLYHAESGACRSSTELAGNSVTYDLQYPIVITHDGWLVDVVNQTSLSKLPPTILTTSLVATAACRTAITFATRHELFVMHFDRRVYPQAPQRLEVKVTTPSFIHDPDAREEPEGDSSLMSPLRDEGQDHVAIADHRLQVLANGSSTRSNARRLVGFRRTLRSTMDRIFHRGGHEQ